MEAIKLMQCIITEKQSNQKIGMLPTYPPGKEEAGDRGKKVRTPLRVVIESVA